MGDLITIARLIGCTSTEAYPDKEKGIFGRRQVAGSMVFSYDWG